MNIVLNIIYIVLNIHNDLHDIDFKNDTRVCLQGLYPCSDRGQLQASLPAVQRGSTQGKKTRLCAMPFYTKMIILSRQARDKHMENSKKRCVVL
eukprot:COSAG06_NODE_5116_length_3711_cov_2.390642_7_plen_94_part_00